MSNFDDYYANYMNILDCTLRDGGYYNSWIFPTPIIQDYLIAMDAIGVDYVEIGFRSLKTSGFRGPCAFSTDEFLDSVKVPQSLSLSVMINASELYTSKGWELAINELFPLPAVKARVCLVRIACHLEELSSALLAASWLKGRGYKVGINLMQASEINKKIFDNVFSHLENSSIDVLYFADSMGSMASEEIKELFSYVKSKWVGDIGIHAHDNMGLALSNTLLAATEGATWLDSTVTGMGRGPGNVRTEQLMVEYSNQRNITPNFIPLLKVIRDYFEPMKNACGWGTNPFYYLAGKYKIHPTYIQEMLDDLRFSNEDILYAIQKLQANCSKRYESGLLESSRYFNADVVSGSWVPRTRLASRDLLLLGSGPSVIQHREAIESYVRRKKPTVAAINTNVSIDDSLIDMRIACHPFRMMADVGFHLTQRQPLITPFNSLPVELQTRLLDKEILDFGMASCPSEFKFYESSCVTPLPLALAYALAVAQSGGVRIVLLAGFDGYGAGDKRTEEVEFIFSCYKSSGATVRLVSITPSIYRNIEIESIYGI